MLPIKSVMNEFLLSNLTKPVYLEKPDLNQ